jgi:hypothetical protein
VGILGIALRPIRSVIGAAEHEAEVVTPVREIEEIQKQILDGVGAMRRATESIEAHVEVVDTLANTLPTLTAAVQELTEQLAAVVTVLAPLSAAERDVAKVEREFTRLGGLFGVHHGRARAGQVSGAEQPDTGEEPAPAPAEQTPQPQGTEPQS